MGVCLKYVDNPVGELTREGFELMKKRYNHSLPLLVHTLYKAKPRIHQGFYPYTTENCAGYYDYLYIHRSSYTNNLSTPLKSRG